MSIGIIYGGLGPDGQGGQKRKSSLPTEVRPPVLPYGPSRWLKGRHFRIEWGEVASDKHCADKHSQFRVKISYPKPFVVARGKPRPQDDVCRFSLTLPVGHEQATAIRELLNAAYESGLPKDSDHLLLHLRDLRVFKHAWRQEKGMPKRHILTLPSPVSARFFSELSRFSLQPLGERSAAVLAYDDAKMVVEKFMPLPPELSLSAAAARGVLLKFGELQNGAEATYLALKTPSREFTAVSVEEISTQVRPFIPPLLQLTRSPRDIQRQMFIERYWAGDVYRLIAQLHPETGQISFRCSVRTDRDFSIVRGQGEAERGGLDQSGLSEIGNASLSAPETLRPPDDTESRLRLRAYKVLDEFSEAEDAPWVFMKKLAERCSPRDGETADDGAFNLVDERLREGDIDPSRAQLSYALDNDVEVRLEWGDRAAVLEISLDQSKAPYRYNWVVALDADTPISDAEFALNGFVEDVRIVTDSLKSRPERERAAERIARGTRKVGDFSDSSYGEEEKERLLDAMWGSDVRQALLGRPGIEFGEPLVSGARQILDAVDGVRRCAIHLQVPRGRLVAPTCFDTIECSVQRDEIGFTFRNRVSGECSVVIPAAESGRIVELVKAFGEQPRKGSMPLHKRLLQLGMLGGSSQLGAPILRANMPLLERKDSKIYERAGDLVLDFERICRDVHGAEFAEAQIVWHHQRHEAEVILGDRTSYSVSIFCGEDDEATVRVNPRLCTLEESVALAGSGLQFRMGLPTAVPPGRGDPRAETLVGIGGFLRDSAVGEGNLLALVSWLSARGKRVTSQ